MAFKNGDFFEEMFLTKLLEQMAVRSSDGTDHKFYSDIVDEDCLIEIKSHRDWSKSQTTVEVLRTIVQRSINEQQKTGVERGLFTQIHRLFDQVKRNNKKAIVIAGVYTEEVNKLYNTFLNQADRAFAYYNYYDILVFDQYFSALCRMTKDDFWSLVKNSSNLTDLHQHLCYETIEITNQCKSLCNVRAKNDPEFALWEVFKGNTVKKRDGQKYTIEQIVDNGEEWSWENKEFWGQGVDESQTTESWGNPSNELWGQNIIDTQQLEMPLDQATQNWIEEQEQAQIEPVEKITKDQVTLFKSDQLELIEKAVADHEFFSVISKTLGYASNYIAQIISPTNGNYSKEEYSWFRNWFIGICLESSHPETPSNRCNLHQLKLINDSLRLKLRGHTSQNTGLRKSKVELENQVKELTESRVRQRNIITGLELKVKKQEEEIKAMANAETQEDKGLSQIQKEAYQAEIEKHKIDNEEFKACIERSKTRALETETVNLNHLIEELEEELEEQKSIAESLRDTIHDAYQKDLERYRKIIDMLLKQLDEQENE